MFYEKEDSMNTACSNPFMNPTKAGKICFLLASPTPAYKENRGIVGFSLKTGPLTERKYYENSRSRMIRKRLL